jgi:hypothetical protein
VHEQALQGVANAGALHLGVLDDGQGLLLIGVLVDIDVADALVVLEDRHGRILDHGPDEPLAAARDDHVYVLVQGQQVLDRGPVRGRHDLHAALGQTGRLQGTAQETSQNLVGMVGFGTAAQDDAVAGLEAEDGRVDGHVGAGFVDDGDDAQRECACARPADRWDA